MTKMFASVAHVIYHGLKQPASYPVATGLPQVVNLLDMSPKFYTSDG
jgi:hypothetical protein